MDYKEFLVKFKENPSEAREYKEQFIPKRLYKYMSLENELDKKICNLSKNGLWLSTLKALNDPFEYGTMFINTDLLKMNNFTETEIKHCVDTYERLKTGFLIGSFSTTCNKTYATVGTLC